MVTYEDVWSKGLINSTDHILIAGRTGAGKSSLINNMIYSILCASPSEHAMILIDPKGLEFDPYRNTPHCLDFAETNAELQNTLQTCYQFAKNRYNKLKGTGKRSSDETKVHIIIDELMVIMLDKENRIASKYLQGLLAMARAANIQIILATQCPKATVIPTEIKANCGIIIGLQTRNAQDSRNILDENGCENLPRHGKALVQDPDHQNTYMVDLKMVNEKHIKELVDWRLAGN